MDNDKADVTGVKPSISVYLHEIAALLTIWSKDISKGMGVLTLVSNKIDAIADIKESEENGYKTV